MALIQSTAIPSGATDYELEQSLRFNGAGYLSKTPSSSSNRKTSTFSTWVKISPAAATGGQDVLFEAYEDNANRWSIFIGDNTTNYIGVFGETGDSTDVNLATNVAYRDYSAWYHIMFVLDTTQGTAANRAKLYVNGEQVTSFSTATYPSQNDDLILNKNVTHHIGAGSWSGSIGNYYLNGYMSETHFIDGQALTPADFGETGDYGEWKPKAYSGSYGTNGFYLPFKQDYTVEGFSTVTWKGNSVNNRYFGGVGFNPDLIWTKARSIGYSGSIYDSVRGYGSVHNLVSSTTEAENGGNHVYGGIDSSSADGFTTFVGSDGGNPYANHNEDGKTYVAWNWDMGSPAPKMVTSSGVQTDTGDKKFGVSSARLINGQSDRLTVPTNDDWNLLSKTNYTIDLWVKHRTTINSDEVYVSQTEGSYANSWYFRAVSGGEVNFTAWDAGTNIVSVRTGAGVVTTDNWHHVALVKSGNTYKIFIDGTDETDSGGTDSSTWSSSTAELRIGDNGSGQWLDAFIDEIRLSDVARYSSNFTPATSAYTRDANTLLLLHMDGANNGSEFLDHSGMDVNTSGSITSNVKANTTYGQSIVSFTGTGSSATVGHGLSSKPDVVLTKRRDSTSHWLINDWSGDYANKLKLNDTEASSSSDNFVNDASATTFTLGTDTDVNANNGTYIAYCWHSVAGYSKFGSYTGNGSATGPSVTTGFAPAFLLIKNTGSAHGWQIYDNTRNPTNPVNNMLVANTNAAEVSNSSDYKVDFTSTGFQVKTADVWLNENSETMIYMAFADKREYAYWLDQSGNNNDWTSNNLTESDISVDSPTNNFATMNPLDSDVTLSEGNLSITTDASSDSAVRSSMVFPSGKWYVETLLKSYGGGTQPFHWGIGKQNTSLTSWVSGGDYAVIEDDGSMKTDGSNVSPTYYSGGFAAGDVIGMAVNVNDNQITFYKNGVSLGAHSYTIEPDEYFVFIGDGSTVRYGTTIVNFGQDSSFAGNKTAQGNQDGNDIGDFYYTPPTGFLALCTKNLPDVAVTPSEHFNTILYTGDDATGKSITGVGFSPSFIWFKERNNTAHHVLHDAVRGASGGRLSSNRNNAEDASTSIASFDSDGFTVGSSAAYINSNNANIVAWNWKANGSGSSNTDGSINTTSTSANVDAGFSISTYTSNGTAGATVGHGLSKAPELVMIKNRDSAYEWAVAESHTGSGFTSNNILFLDLTNAYSSSGNIWNSTAPSSSLVTLGDNLKVNGGSSHKHIMYCFHSVDGYSKVGSYTGNGNADGTFVYTGFRPAFVMLKKTGNAANGSGWVINDSKRLGYNNDNPRLRANTSGQEDDTGRVELLSNGFKMRVNYAESNEDGVNFIYLAFAETPFKYSNAR